jgi:hypothetical protein
MNPSWMRDVIVRFYPRSRAAAMEAGPRQWTVRCRTCGAERSIWDLDGSRWKGKAKGRMWMYRRCPGCDRLRWHDVDRRERNAPAGGE